MVRPIEITDTISKVQAVERLQQNAKLATEAVQQFQKELNEKIAGEQVTITNPATQGDRLILHTEEREREQKKPPDEESPESASDEKHPHGESPEDRGPDHGTPPGHIDITV